MRWLSAWRRRRDRTAASRALRAVNRHLELADRAAADDPVDLAGWLPTWACWPTRAGR